MSQNNEIIQTDSFDSEDVSFSDDSTETTESFEPNDFINKSLTRQCKEMGSKLHDSSLLDESDEDYDEDDDDDDENESDEFLPSEFQDSSDDYDVHEDEEKRNDYYQALNDKTLDETYNDSVLLDIYMNAFSYSQQKLDSRRRMCEEKYGEY